MTEKFNGNHLKNIQTIFEKKTGTKVSAKKNYVNYRYAFAFSAVLLCFLTFSAFAYAKFSSLNGDEVAFYPNYKGNGIVEITIDNYSDVDLVLEEQIQLRRWSTGEEVVGDKDKVTFSNTEIEADSRETIRIDLSKGYDMEELEKPLSSNDHYYLILTNNNFAFGQDWMCSIDFDGRITCEVPDRDSGKYSSGKVTEVVKADTEEVALVYEEWKWPTESQVISQKYGDRGNDRFSEHINIAGEKGDKVYAVANGKVVETGFDGTIGNYIVLDLGDGKNVKYGHLEKVSVTAGEEVRAGDKIGKLGQSGMATGPNLYFAVYEDESAVNPLKE